MTEQSPWLCLLSVCCFVAITTAAAVEDPHLRVVSAQIQVSFVLFLAEETQLPTPCASVPSARPNEVKTGDFLMGWFFEFSLSVPEFQIDMF